MQNGKLILGREAILAAKPRIEVVEVPELGGQILLRELKAGQMMDIRELGEGPNQAAAQLSLMIVNEDGVLIFNKEDVAALNEISASVVMKLLTAAAKLNGVNIETAAKNSEAIPTASSAIN